MKDIVKFFDDLPYIVKIILALPFIDGIAWGIYRIAKGKIVLGIIWILVGWAIFWIIDLASLLLYKDIRILA